MIKDIPEKVCEWGEFIGTTSGKEISLMAGEYSNHYIICSDRRIVGSVVVLPEKCTIDDLYINTKWRGMGVGTVVVKGIEKRLANQGCAEILVDATDTSKPFWEMMGFDVYSSYEDFSRMKKGVKI